MFDFDETSSNRTTAILIDVDGNIIDTIPANSARSYQGTVDVMQWGSPSPPSLPPILKKKKERQSKPAPPRNRHERRRQNKLDKKRSRDNHERYKH